MVEVMGVRDKSGWHCVEVAIHRRVNGVEEIGIDVRVSNERGHRMVHMFVLGGTISREDCYQHIELAREIMQVETPAQKYESFTFEGVA